MNQQQAISDLARLVRELAVTINSIGGPAYTHLMAEIARQAREIEELVEDK